MRIRRTHGFTVLEAMIAIAVAGILMSGLWAMMDQMGREELHRWEEANRRSANFNIERLLAPALRSAGAGMPSTLNLGGIHIRTAGAASDTLFVLRGDGERIRVASRGCSSGAASCIAVLGDQRGALPAGSAVVYGTEGTHMGVGLVTSTATFRAPCGADCAGRVDATFAPTPAPDLRYVQGSTTGGIPSAQPCEQPVYPDGTRCDEVEGVRSLAPPAPRSYLASSPERVFTEVRVSGLGGAWRVPNPYTVTALRAGAGSTPAPLLQKVRAERFWVRTQDSTLVRQTEPTAGGWARTAALAAPVVSLRVETLHHGETAWRRGIGLAAADMTHSASNPNFLRQAAGPAAPRAWRFLRGYHSVAEIRAHYELIQGARTTAPVREAHRITVSTPQIRMGALAEGDR